MCLWVLGEIKVGDVIHCNDVYCNNESHTACIDNLYNQVTCALSKSTQFLSKKSKCIKTVSGWNEYCKVAHETARDAYLSWRCNGSPRHGQ